MSYKSKATTNREALFGKSNGSKNRSENSASSNNDIGRQATPKSIPSSQGYKYGGMKNSALKVGLSGDAKAAKMKEAEDYRDKARKAMQKGLFTKADPLAASTYYKRAADTYQLCGESRLERLYRINSADCQALVGAWATAAAEYSRAADLVKVAVDESTEMKREIGRKLHLSAADAWRNMNDPGKAAASTVQAALALIWDDESRLLSKIAVEALEQAVECFVPDPLNPYARYRQTGLSAYVDQKSIENSSDPSVEVVNLAKQHLVNRAYAHEPLQEVQLLLVSSNEYASALYVSGAITTLLLHDGVSTLTLSRAFLAETIISLAMGDPIAAEENFLSRHVQNSTYLASRECKLAEDLFRAVKARDEQSLEEARSVKGSNRSGIGNLPSVLRELLENIRITGVARRVNSEEVSATSCKQKPPSAEQDFDLEPSLEELGLSKTGHDDEQFDTEELQNELDALDFGDDESDIDDEDIDLR